MVDPEGQWISEVGALQKRPHIRPHSTDSLSEKEGRGQEGETWAAHVPPYLVKERATAGREPSYRPPLCLWQHVCGCALRCSVPDFDKILQLYGGIFQKTENELFQGLGRRMSFLKLRRKRNKSPGLWKTRSVSPYGLGKMCRVRETRKNHSPLLG